MFNVTKSNYVANVTGTVVYSHSFAYHHIWAYITELYTVNNFMEKLQVLVPA